MKINIVYICDVTYHVCYKVIIEKEEDYGCFGSVIMEGDVIEMKDMENFVYVSKVENYNTSIKIFGYETKSIPGYYTNYGKFDENKMNSYLLKDKIEFILYRSIVSYDIDQWYIYEQLELYEEEKEKKKLASDVDIQNKCFEILKEHIIKKSYLIIYGMKSLKLLENGRLKVLLIAYDTLKKQNEKYKDIIKKENHKYKETNIVIYDEKSKYFEEFINYGGIIGVLNDK